MRAKLPSTGRLRRTRRREASTTRSTADGPQTMVFRAALEHRPFARLQGAAALFQRALPLHRLRRAAATASPTGRTTWRPTRSTTTWPTRWRSWTPPMPDKAILVGLSYGGLLACVLAALPSRAGEGRHPGRHGGDRRARLPLHDAQHFLAEQRAASRAGTSTTAPIGWRTIPTSPSTSSATSAPSRTRPSRSRTASPGRPRPPARCWSRPWKRGRSCRRSTSARRCIARSAARCWRSTATTTRSSPTGARRLVAELHRRRARDHSGRRPQSARPLPAEVQRPDHRFPRPQARHCRARSRREQGRQAAESQAGALSLLADRPRARAARHRHRARAAQAASRPRGRLAGAGSGDAPARGQRRAHPSAERAAGQRDRGTSS